MQFLTADEGDRSLGLSNTIHGRALRVTETLSVDVQLVRVLSTQDNNMLKHPASKHTRTKVLCFHLTKNKQTEICDWGQRDKIVERSLALHMANSGSSLVHP